MRDLREHLDDLTDILLALDPAATFLRPRRIIVRDNQVGTLTLALRYSDGSRLDVELEADCSGPFPLWGDYAFHYADPDGQIRFRYDSAPHYSALFNFPHHLHIRTGEVLPFGPPTIRQIAAAIVWHLDHPDETWRPGAE